MRDSNISCSEFDDPSVANLCYAEASSPTIISQMRVNFKKRSYRRSENSILSWKKSTSVILTTNPLVEYFENSTWKTLVNTAICTWKPTCFYWPIFSRTFAIFSYTTISSTVATSIRPPRLSFAAMLRMTGVELDVLSDIDQLYMFENEPNIAETRGSEKLLHEKIMTQTSQWATYRIWTANNLYGWAMTQPLPMRDFRFLSREEASGWY